MPGWPRAARPRTRAHRAGCAKGLIPIQPSAAGLAFATPATRALPLPAHLHLIYEALGITNEQVLDAASTWQTARALGWCLLLDSPGTPCWAWSRTWRASKALGHKVGVAARYQADDTPRALIGRACREADLLHPACAPHRPQPRPSWKCGPFPPRVSKTRSPAA